MSKTAAETRKQKAALRSLMANGATEYTCMKELKITKLSVFRSLRQAVIADGLEEIHGETAASTFIRYKIRIDSLCSDLDEVIAEGKGDARSLNAVVGAVKAKGNLLKEVLERGQALGVLPTSTAEPEKIGKETAELESLKDKLRADLEKMYATGVTPYEDEDEETVLYFEEKTK